MPHAPPHDRVASFPQALELGDSTGRRAFHPGIQVSDPPLAEHPGELLGQRMGDPCVVADLAQLVEGGLRGVCQVFGATHHQPGGAARREMGARVSGRRAGRGGGRPRRFGDAGFDLPVDTQVR